MLEETKEKLREEVQDTKKELMIERVKLTKTRQALQKIADAPSVTAQRKLMYQMFADEGINPLEIMIHQMQEVDDPKTKFEMAEKLAQYFASKPKSVDIQADVKSNLEINVVDFSNVTQKALKEATQETQAIDGAIDVTPVEEPDYSAFMSDEDIMAQEGEKEQ